MSFRLSRSSSPTRDSGEHGAFPNHSKSAEPRPKLQILLDSEYVALKGTGVDVDSSILSGHVALYLAESTSIKQITLQFRGKCRLPAPGHDSALNGNTITYVICNHDWSFLEGHKKHNHTLKAGKHFFPFQLQIGGSLPSSLYTPAFGGAAVSYKLHAHATRGAFSHDLDTVIPVSIIRSFSAEALEYQQTLEIENTWPQKILYSIMLPHKAIALGDTLIAQVKFVPLSKGIRVLAITSVVQESVKVVGCTSYPDYTKAVCTAKHEFQNGQAILVSSSRLHTPPASTSAGAPGSLTPTGAPSTRPSASGQYFPSVPSSPSTSSFIPGSYGLPLPSSPTDTVQPSSISVSYSPSQEQGEDHDIISFVSLYIPLQCTPSHGLDPIHISHRIRWSILISNPDGHTSELRCSLPLHLLDHRLLDEAKAHSSATRRLLIGGPDVETESSDELQLPSYTAHVRDRVANMYLPAAATMRVSNPWVINGTSPTLTASTDSSSFPSGAASPLEAHLLNSHLPHTPSMNDMQPLDWVNSELLLSLSLDSPHELQTPLGAPHTEPSHHVHEANHPWSRPVSRPTTRPGSRAPSPDRHGHTRSSGHHQHPDEHYIHSGHASRAMPGLFNASMKPFTSLTHPNWLHRSNSYGPALQQEPERTQDELPSATQLTLQRDVNQLHHAFTAVPNYDMAAQGFLGGVPPLSSMTGLPSYDDAQRSQRSRRDTTLGVNSIQATRTINSSTT